MSGDAQEILEAFEGALRSDYNYAALARMLEMGLNRRIEEETYATNADLRQVAWKLVSRAWHEKWLLDLIEAARKHNPDGPTLREFWDHYGDRIASLGESGDLNPAKTGGFSPDALKVGGSLVSFVDRTFQKSEVRDALIGEHPGKPLVFVVRSSLEQDIDKFKIALEQRTIPLALGTDPLDPVKEAGGLEPGIFHFITFDWSPRRGMGEAEWRERLSKGAVLSLGADPRRDPAESLQARIDELLCDEQSQLGIEYNLPESEANRLAPFFDFWRGFRVGKGTFVVLLKITVASKKRGFRLPGLFAGLFGRRPSFAGESVRDLQELGDVYVHDVNEWWGKFGDRIAASSHLKENPAPEIFPDSETGFSMREFERKVESYLG